MIKGFQPTYGYTDNGNKYQKCTVGKKAGTALGTAYVVANTVLVAKDPFYKNLMKYMFNSMPDKLSKVILGGTLTASSALCIGLVIGIYKLIGHGFDSIVNKISQNKADKAAMKEEENNPKVEETAQKQNESVASTVTKEYEEINEVDEIDEVENLNLPSEPTMPDEPYYEPEPSTPDEPYYEPEPATPDEPYYEPEPSTTTPPPQYYE